MKRARMAIHRRHRETPLFLPWRILPSRPLETCSLFGSAIPTPVVLRVTVSGPTNPFVVHDELHLVGGEEAYGKVFAVNAMDLILEDPVAAPVLSASGFLERIAPTGHSTANA